MDNPVEGIAKVQPEGSGSAPAAGSAPSPVRPASGPAPEAPRDTVDFSASAQAAAEASARVLQARQASRGDGASSPEKPLLEGLSPNISFNYNKEVGILQAAVVDPVTHKVIRQIPPDEVLKMGLRFRNFVKERLDAAQKVSDTATVGFESGQAGDSGGEHAA